MTGYIRVQQIRSPIRRHYSQRLTLKGLGLNKIGRIVVVPFNGPTWGMIQKVRHLVRFPDQAIYEQHRLVLPQPINEKADEALMRTLVFKGQALEAVRLPEGKNKSPDFKLMKGGELKAYCELKSPRDDRVLAVPRDLKPGEIRREIRENPAAHALARVIEKAAAQFDAVNPDHVYPNILIIVSHARLRGPVDLHLAIAGLPVPGGGTGFLLVDPNEKDFKKAWEKQRKLWDDARKIDLFYWIDAHTKTVRHVINNDGAKRREARDLMKIDA
ncbi:50S ribosomal protein L30 [Bradyrhizobium sp. I71]|nr:50S ribosomal protein L30 [Bradyrhizobium sp. I71]